MCVCVRVCVVVEQYFFENEFDKGKEGRKKRFVIKLRLGEAATLHCLACGCAGRGSGSGLDVGAENKWKWESGRGSKSGSGTEMLCCALGWWGFGVFVGVCSCVRDEM